MRLDHDLKERHSESRQALNTAASVDGKRERRGLVPWILRPEDDDYSFSDMRSPTESPLLMPRTCADRHRAAAGLALAPARAGWRLERAEVAVRFVRFKE